MDDLQNLRVQDVAWQGNGYGEVRWAQGGRVVMFYNKSVHNPAKSAEEGRRVFENQVFFKSFMPGEQRFEIVDRPANQRDKAAYPQQWAAFQQNRDQTPEGTPINLLYPEQPSIASTLEAYGVHTIEQCAALNATAIDNIGMGCQAWVNHAQKYLDVANRGVSVTKFRRELDERDGQIRVLQQTVDQLKAQINRLQTQQATGGESGGVDPALVQAVVAQIQSARGTRATLPIDPSQVFDAQTAQINATHATGDIARTKKIRRAKAGT